MTIASELWNSRQEQLLKLSKEVAALNVLDDLDVRGNVALVMLNQLQYNEDPKNNVPNFIKQLSVPSALRIFSSVPNIFGVQAFDVNVKDNKLFFLNNPGEVNTLNTAPFNPTFEAMIVLRDHPLFNNTELAQQCLELSVAITDDIVAKILEHILSGAAHKFSTELHSVDGVLESINKASDQIKKSIGRAANFVVLPIDVARYLKNEMTTEYDFDSLPINIRRVGCIKNKFIVYFNSYEKRILVGYRGSHPADTGYILNPGLQFCNFKKEENRFTVFCKKQQTYIAPNYYACIELTADKRAVSIDKF